MLTHVFVSFSTTGYSQYQIGILTTGQQSDSIPVNDVPTSYQQGAQDQADIPIDPAFEALAAVVAASANADHNVNGAALPADDDAGAAPQAKQQASAGPGPGRPRKSRPRNDDDDDDDEAFDLEALGDDAPPPRSPRPVRAASSRWTPEEDEQLINLVKEEPALSWNTIGEKLNKRGQVCGQRWYNFLAEFNPGERNRIWLSWTISLICTYSLFRGCSCRA